MVQKDWPTNGPDILAKEWPSNFGPDFESEFTQMMPVNRLSMFVEFL